MRASEKTRVLQKIAFQQGVRIFHSSPYSFSGHFELGIGQCLIFRSYFTSDEFEFLHQLKIDIREQLSSNFRSESEGTKIQLNPILNRKMLEENVHDIIACVWNKMRRK